MHKPTKKDKRASRIKPKIDHNLQNKIRRRIIPDDMTLCHRETPNLINSAHNHLLMKEDLQAHAQEDQLGPKMLDQNKCHGH